MPKFDQRNGFNLNFLEFERDYLMINHLNQGFGQLQPIGADWATTTKTWMQCLDPATGYPNDPTAQTQRWGGAIWLPDTANFTGPYILEWDGELHFQMASGTWTVNSSSGVTVTGSGTIYTSNAASGHSSINLTNTTTPGGGPTLNNMWILTDPNSNGNYGHNIKFYRAADASRQAAGKMFRTPFLQQIANLNPGHIRFLNWCAWASQLCRFEHRPVPTKQNPSALASPPYGETTGTNAIALAAVTTGGNQTPVSMQHGEVVTCRIGNTIVRAGGVSITAITNANPGVVTTSSAHGFNTGDVIVHYLGEGVMPHLNMFPVTITFVDSTHYSIGVNTTSLGAFSTSPPLYAGTAPFAAEYVTLNVGARGDFPIILTPDYYLPIAAANIIGGGTTQITAHDYKVFYFDKTISAKTDGSGNLIYGVWIWQIDGGSTVTPGFGYPLEWMTQFTNEVNEISTAQGNCPSGMWLTMPGRSLMTSSDVTFDPDYSSGSEYPVQAIGVVKNGANGFNPLGYGATLWIEYGNETWNFTSMPQSYLSMRGYQRFGAGSGNANVVDMYALRSTLMMRSIKAAYPSDNNINYVLSGQGGIGYAGLNFARINGNTYYNADSVNTWGTAPIVSHDCFAVASYFDPQGAYCVGSGAGSFTDDSAMYAGTTPYSSPNQAQAIANFIVVTKASDGSGNQIDYYLSSTFTGVIADISAAMAGFGKKCVGYEGGTDWATVIGTSLQGHSITTADSAFLIGVINSTQWRDAQLGFFNRCATLSGCANQSVLLPLATDDGNLSDQRWAYGHPDSYLNGVEGGALSGNPTWVGMGARNALLCSLLNPSIILMPQACM